jgi:hypothetical protein
MANDGSCHSLRPLLTRRTAPTTPRISSKPMPGQPPANVEYSRRNTHQTDYCVVGVRSESPCGAADVTLSGSWRSVARERREGAGT